MNVDLPNQGNVVVMLQDVSVDVGSKNAVSCNGFNQVLALNKGERVFILLHKLSY